MFLENVKNLKGHDNGNTFKVIKKTLEDLNYVVYDKVMNAETLIVYGEKQNTLGDEVIPSATPFDAWLNDFNHTYIVSQLLQDMKELITQNYNHASIVVWGLSNEITMHGAADPDLIENHRILNDMCHKMDKTRLTTIAAVSMAKIDDAYIHISDVVSYNHYFGWYGGDTTMNGPWFDKFHKWFRNLFLTVENHPNMTTYNDNAPYKE